MEPLSGSVNDRMLQASGMIAAQLDCSTDEAFERLSEQAETSGKTLHEIATDVIARVTRSGR